MYQNFCADRRILSTKILIPRKGCSVPLNYIILCIHYQLQKTASDIPGRSQKKMKNKKYFIFYIKEHTPFT